MFEIKPVRPTVTGQSCFGLTSLKICQNKFTLKQIVKTTVWSKKSWLGLTGFKTHFEHRVRTANLENEPPEGRKWSLKPTGVKMKTSHKLAYMGKNTSLFRS